MSTFVEIFFPFVVQQGTTLYLLYNPVGLKLLFVLDQFCFKLIIFLKPFILKLLHLVDQIFFKLLLQLLFEIDNLFLDILLEFLMCTIVSRYHLLKELVQFGRLIFHLFIVGYPYFRSLCCRSFRLRSH